MLPDSFNVLSDMYYFAKVAEFGSYSLAERALGVPKSRLSRRVAQLERLLGVRLIERSPRHFALSEAGAVFLQHCERVVQEAERGLDAVRRLQEAPRGTVRVACMVNANRVLLAPIVPGFLATHPGVGLHIVATNRAVDLYAEGIDVALRVGPEIDESDSVMIRKVMETRQYLVAAPSLLAERGPCTTLEQLREFPTLDISTPGGRHTWLLGTRDGRSVAFNHQPRLISDDIETLRFAAHAGAGVVRISERMISDDLQAGRLVAVLPGWSLRPNQVYLAFLASKGLTPSVRAFVEYVCATLPDAVHRSADPALASVQDAGSGER
jgi:DNA-binding transcriptional LysR family regulator